MSGAFRHKTETETLNRETDKGCTPEYVDWKTRPKKVNRIVTSQVGTNPYLVTKDAPSTENRRSEKYGVCLFNS